MNGVVVDGALDGLSGNELVQLLQHEIVLEGLRRIVIELAALAVFQIVVAAVVAVMAQNGDLIPEPRRQPMRQGGFPGVCASGDADNQWLHGALPFCFSVYDIISFFSPLFNPAERRKR